MTLASDWVAPKMPPGQPSVGNTQAEVRVSLTRPAPAGCCIVELKVDIPDPKSGGHDHGLINDGRPKGSISPTNVSFSSGETEKTATYTSSEVSGTEEIILTVRGTEKEIKKYIDVKVKGLHPMPGGMYYVLVGSPKSNDPCRFVPPTSQHNENHYGTWNLIYAVKQIARKYASQSTTPYINLRVNDMSLPGGGAFDVYNHWLADTTAPQCKQKGHGHCTHRLGINADIGFVGWEFMSLDNNRCVGLDKKVLFKIIRDVTGIPPYIHSDHYHIYSTAIRRRK
ncbi:MAG: hypothetical protein HY805_07995 [Nitrospirae bacterium]|nr:hypothetical protein [Nitrospirota bacterium]